MLVGARVLVLALVTKVVVGSPLRGADEELLAIVAPVAAGTNEVVTGVLDPGELEETKLLVETLDAVEETVGVVVVVTSIDEDTPVEVVCAFTV